MFARRHWLAENRLSVRDYLNLFNAKLSPKRCSWGLKSQEMGNEGDYTSCYTVTTRMTSASRLTGSDESRFKVSSTVRGKVARQCLLAVSEEKREPKQSNWGPAYQPNALPPGQVGSHQSDRGRWEVSVLFLCHQEALRPQHSADPERPQHSAD